MAKYEGSKADRARDKKRAKARGATLKAYEASAADKKAAAAGQRALDRKKRKKRP